MFCHQSVISHNDIGTLDEIMIYNAF